jgi:hypothetical protein
MFLYNAFISCHHGHGHKENHLESVKTLTQHYDIIEIDFVYMNNQYISAHDYDDDQIKQGSLLEEWIDFIMVNKKILWIDLKDLNINVITYSTTLNITALINILDLKSLKYPQLKEHILIGCQFINGYNQLVNTKHRYVVINDLPKDYMYALKTIIPSFCQSLINLLTSYVIQNQNEIIALDQSFFNKDRLEQFINDCTASIIIVYNYNLNDEVPKSNKKHLIIQYNVYN